MKVLALSMVATVTALVPMTPTMSMQKVQGRRAVLEQVTAVTAAALLGAQPAFADGAVSAATVQRAKGIYGSRIAALKSAVDSGDFEAVLDEKNAFVLFNSGAYATKGPLQKEQQAVSKAATDDIFAAVESKDKGALKTAYAAFMKNANINTAGVDVSSGQGYSTDYDWKNRTPKGAIYQR